jgi:hypothetical protein
MPIINSQHPRNPVWTHVSFPMSLELIPESKQVMIGYGSGDQIPRVKMMPWEDVAKLFPVPRQEVAAAWRARAMQRLRGLLQHTEHGGSSSSSRGSSSSGSSSSRGGS